MCSRFQSSALALALLVTPLSARAEDLKICAEPDSLPFSRSDGQGFEIELASVLAFDLGRQLKVLYVAQRTYGFLRASINAGRCDVLMGVPSGFDRLTTTQPWYRSSYMVVSPASRSLDIQTFDDERLRTLKIGVPMSGAPGGGPPPAIALTEHGHLQSIRPYSVFEPQAAVAAVARGELDMAMVWGPFATWHAQQHSPALAISRPPETSSTTFIFEIALGVRKGNEPLRDALQAALIRNRVSVDRILDRWHVPRIQD